MENSWTSWCSSPKPTSRNIGGEEGNELNHGYSESEESSTWTEVLSGYSDYVRRLEAGEAKKDEDYDDQQGGAKEGFVPDQVYSSRPFGRSDSMASDAGSGPEWKQQMMIHNHQSNSHPTVAVANTFAGDVEGGVSSPPPPAGNYNNNTLRKLNFKNKRSKEIPYDDSLEDTASSPVNSPKITMGLKRMDLNARRGTPLDLENNNSFSSALIGKGEEEYGNHLDDQMQIIAAAPTQKQYYQPDSTTSKKMIIHNAAAAAEDSTTTTTDHELQKKGLCLVPVSMIPTNFMNYYNTG